MASTMGEIETFFLWSIGVPADKPTCAGAASSNSQSLDYYRVFLLGLCSGI